MSTQSVELPPPPPHKAIPAAPSNLSPNYSIVFHFEEEFDNVKIKPYIEEYWKMVVFTSIGEKSFNSGPRFGQGPIPMTPPMP